MKKVFLVLCMISFLVTDLADAQNVLVSPGAGSYTTLKAAFDAINAGTHTGAITIDIILSTTETASAVLNASGTGSSSYSSVLISPSGSSKTITSSTGVGLSVIELRGADNVTIDGRIAGTGRNLSIINTGTGSCIWLSPGNRFTPDTAGAKHNTIRNCILKSGTDYSVFSSSDNFGIISCGDVEAGTDVTNQGRNNDGNKFLDNYISKVRYGIYMRGHELNLNDSNTVSDNLIGPPAFGSDQIGKGGIIVFYQNGCSISNNEIRFTGILFAQTASGNAAIGIGIGTEILTYGGFSFTRTTGINHTVNGNIIHDIVDENRYSSAGISVQTTIDSIITGNIISNNVIYNIRSNGVCAGISHSGGAGDKIVYNSLSLTGDLDPSGTASATAGSMGIRVSYPYTSDSALIIRNNSVYVNLTSNTSTIKHYCISMPTALYNWGTGGGCSNNDYYYVSPQNICGSTGPGPFTEYAALGDWKLVFTPSQDAGSISSDPLYTTSTYLFPMTGSPLLSAGTPVAGVTKDILGEIRSSFSPTIGAYENDSATLPVELISFTSSVSNRDVTLNWITVSEINNSGFEIERYNINEAVWKKVAFLNGNGTVFNINNYSFTDHGLNTGRYNYRLKQLDFNGNFEYFNLKNEVIIGVASEFHLSQNFPNPFNPVTNIEYELPFDSFVSIKLFDMTGREITTIVREFKTAGYYKQQFDATRITSGAYIYEFTASGNDDRSEIKFNDIKKMIILK